MGWVREVYVPLFIASKQRGFCERTRLGTGLVTYALLEKGHNFLERSQFVVCLPLLVSQAHYVLTQCPQHNERAQERGQAHIQQNPDVQKAHRWNARGYE